MALAPTCSRAWHAPPGDYDFARDASGRYRTHHETSEFLAAVLGSPPNAKCDRCGSSGG